ncbi:MAG: low molecular weight phosphatase family protein [Candidatus Sericytochromatia bacterium]
MKQVLFACVHNTGRSQMAEAFFNRLAEPAEARAASGGVEPVEAMNPMVLEVMREVGIDLVAEGHHPKLARAELVKEMDYVFSMG